MELVSELGTLGLTVAAASSRSPRRASGSTCWSRARRGWCVVGAAAAEGEHPARW